MHDPSIDCPRSHLSPPHHRSASASPPPPRHGGGAPTRAPGPARNGMPVRIDGAGTKGDFGLVGRAAAAPDYYGGRCTSVSGERMAREADGSSV